MYKQILVPVDLADTDLAKPAIDTAVSMAKNSGGKVCLVNVLPMTPVMLAEYVPPDFDAQQRKFARRGWFRRSGHNVYVYLCSTLGLYSFDH